MTTIEHLDQRSEAAGDGKLQGKRILIIQQRGWAPKMGHVIAKKLQDEGAILAAYTVKKSSDHFVRTQKEVHYEQILSYEALMESLDGLDEPDISFAEIEKDLDLQTAWPMLCTERTLVWNYGQKWYYGYNQAKSDEFIRKYGKHLYLQMKELFATFEPDLVISPNIIFPPHIIAERLCAKRGINIMCVSESKIRGISVFNYKFDFSDGPFIRRIQALNECRASSENLERADRYIEEFRSQFKSSQALDYIMNKRNRLSLTAVARKLASSFKRALTGPHWGSPNYVATLGPTTDYQPPRIMLRDALMPTISAWRVQKLTFHSLDDIGPFVYYPLQLQPEAPLDNMAYLYNNQFEMARLIARCLPGDYTLVTKEHPGMLGRRGPKPYRRLMTTPNVKLLETDYPTRNVLERASLVIGPGSTTMVESAFLGIPAIQFGDHSLTESLPNVVRAGSFDQLAGQIARHLQMDCTTPEYRQKLRNYVAAAFDTGFDFNYFGAWEQGEDFDTAALWRIYKPRILEAMEPK